MLAVVSVRMTVWFFQMIVRDVVVAMVFCRPYVFPTVFVSCVMDASRGASVSAV